MDFHPTDFDGLHLVLPGDAARKGQSRSRNSGVMSRRRSLVLNTQ